MMLPAHIKWANIGTYDQPRWQDKLRHDWQLDCLELSLKPILAAFMPTIRGADTGSKKRYAGRK